MSAEAPTVHELAEGWARQAAMADLRDATRAVEEATRQQAEAIRLATDAGASVREIGAVTGWHYSTVSRFLRAEEGAR